MGVPPIPGWCSIRFMYLYIECRMQRRRNLLRPRKAQRGPESQSVDITNLYALGWRLPTSRFATREVPYRFLYVWNPRGSPRGLPLCKSTSIPLPPHKQNYVRPGRLHTYPKAELRPGRLPTTRITTREPTYIHTHKHTYDQGAGCRLVGWRNYDQGACCCCCCCFWVLLVLMLVFLSTTLKKSLARIHSWRKRLLCLLRPCSGASV